MAAGRKLAYSASGDRSRHAAAILVRGAFLAVLALAAACTRAENDPHQVANQFVKALHTRDEGLLDGLRSQLDEIRAMQLDIMWREFVFAEFETEYPIDVVFDQAKYNSRLRIYQYHQLKRIADSLERIAEKMK